MENLGQEIATLSENIWLSVLGLPLHASDTDGQALPSGPTVDGIVTISGDWQGAVIVQVPQPLAQRVATIMFQLGTNEPTLEDCRTRSARSPT